MTISLTAEPTQLDIQASGGSYEVLLTNTGSERLTFKVKCNNNAFYTFKPVFGIIGVGQQKKVEVTRLYGGVSTDKMAIHYLPAPIGVYDPAEPFKQAKTFGAMPSIVDVNITAGENAIKSPDVANQNSYVPTMYDKPV
ncbi:hypothetical protein L596_016228 [Steinernema carpocapsae]|uniref:Major sperm protein n=1 Tax=Steinernema carpocapsae TaxID=34508 RepID=A0A4U5NIK2_STECR|nr:hypothetical protein L596_016228 [Steinernema carpocapsae]